MYGTAAMECLKNLLCTSQKYPEDMTTSYSEISLQTPSSLSVLDLSSFKKTSNFDTRLCLGDKKEKKDRANNRPYSLELKNHKMYLGQCDSIPVMYQNGIGYLQFEGTVMKDGDLISFVAEDLENKIKLSSPITGLEKKNGKVSTFFDYRFLTHCFYRPQFPPLNHFILTELESEARKVATSVDAITENLAAILHSTSALTVGCLQTFRDNVCKTCDTIDYNIKSMYQLMAKCEELSKSTAKILRSFWKFLKTL